MFIIYKKFYNFNNFIEFSIRVQKIKNQLYQKGFAMDQIQQFIDEEVTDEE